MQDGAGGDVHLLLSVLADGEEQARQLDARLGGEPDDGLPRQQPRPRAEEDDQYCCRGLARQLRCTFGKAIAVARAIEAAAGASGSRGTDDRSDSPRSADESSGGTAAQAQERQGMCKRRKGLPRWTKKFRVLDASLEYSPDDGFSWRKYGQKDILGAKFPRGYYRCTYRTAQGCPATKQVQRTDSDLTVFDVTYQGAHTCHKRQRGATSPPAAVAAAHDGNHPPPPPPPSQDPDLQLLASFKNGLKVDTDGLASSSSSFHGHGASSAAFSFPSVPPFHDAAAAGGFSPVESGQQLGGAFSPAFVSPAATSTGSSYFSAPHFPAGARGAESSELGEVVSAATAPAADPAGFDYSLYQYQYHYAELDPHLPFAPLFGHPSHGQH